MSNKFKIQHMARLIPPGILLFILLVIIYSYFFPRWADPNQNSRLDMVFAVVENGTFQIDPYVSNTVDYAKVGDHYYSDKAPGAAFIGIPIYASLKLLLDQPAVDRLVGGLESNSAFESTLNPQGTGILGDKIRFAIAQVMISFFVSVIPTALIGYLIYKILKYFGFNENISMITALIYGLLTPVFAYANAFYGHQLSAFLLFFAFYLLLTRDHLSNFTLFVVGLLLAYSIVSEYPTALISAILFIYGAYKLHERKELLKIVWVILSGSIIALALMIYNSTIFGSPFNFGYQYSELWQLQHQTGFMSLTIPHWDAIWGVTFSQYRGLFFLSPVMLFSIPGIFLWWCSSNHRAELITVLTISTLTLLFNFSSIMWWGGFAVGPRYILPMLPFLSIPIGFSLLTWSDRIIFKIVLSFLCIWSFTAVWGLTLAGQAFPSDIIQSPLLEYAWPNWLSGNIARNIGTVVGLNRFWSLLPLFMIISLAMGAYWITYYGIKSSSPKMHYGQ